jgi:hypothetical protein
MKKVTITTMATGNEEIKSFITENDALNYFISKCNELGYQIENNEAGGRGHDFRIELT